MQRYYAQVIPLDGIDPNQQIRQINAIDESLRQTMSVRQSQDSIFAERPEQQFQPPEPEKPKAEVAQQSQAGLQNQQPSPEELQKQIAQLQQVIQQQMQQPAQKVEPPMAQVQ